MRIPRQDGGQIDIRKLRKLMRSRWATEQLYEALVEVAEEANGLREPAASRPVTMEEPRPLPTISPDADLD